MWQGPHRIVLDMANDPPASPRATSDHERWVRLEALTSETVAILNALMQAEADRTGRVSSDLGKLHEQADALWRMVQGRLFPD